MLSFRNKMSEYIVRSTCNITLRYVWSSISSSIFASNSLTRISIFDNSSILFRTPRINTESLLRDFFPTFAAYFSRFDDGIDTSPAQYLSILCMKSLSGILALLRIIFTTLIAFESSAPSSFISASKSEKSSELINATIFSDPCSIKVDRESITESTPTSSKSLSFSIKSWFTNIPPFFILNKC